MKLVRFGPAGRISRASALDAAWRHPDLSGVIPDIDGPSLSKASLDKAKGLDPSTLPAAPARLADRAPASGASATSSRFG
jgi:hypothetical protein